MTTVARDTLPVFVFPTQLNIFVQERESARQLLTIYNPYNFVIEYRLLCTDPLSYSVQEALGRLKPQSFVDM
ncbi:unnamed protein product [Soboliphyme baturini]|uniref:Motile sperm domain-containing protein 1 n=1 Tax=Soboliphyme baturini TaxID=241478 RepID=A0A183IU12_9BILA|nr:unnamed protein product [Soboliphyme baturini]